MLLLVATRWPLAPKRLYFFDSANFAFALEDFNPALHQPQPPGYPLFVGLTRLIHIFVADPQHVLLIAGLLSAWCAVLLIAALGTRMFGWSAGLLAAALLFANPPFWLAGITNQVRIFLAVGSLGTGLLAWRALQRNAHVGWFYASFGWLGIAAGFRPIESTLLLPLLLWVGALGALCRPVRPGPPDTLRHRRPFGNCHRLCYGGAHKAVEVLWDYANQQFQGSSRLFGASTAAFQMVAEAIVWNFLGALAWIWALPSRACGKHAPPGASVRVFSSSGFSRPSSSLHWFISAIRTRRSLRFPSCVSAAAPFCQRSSNTMGRAALGHGGGRRSSVLGALLLPPRWKLARASSYRAVASIGRITDGAISAIDEVSKDGRPSLSIMVFWSPTGRSHIISPTTTSYSARSARVSLIRRGCMGFSPSQILLPVP